MNGDPELSNLCIQDLKSPAHFCGSQCWWKMGGEDILNCVPISPQQNMLPSGNLDLIAAATFRLSSGRELLPPGDSHSTTAVANGHKDTCSIRTRFEITSSGVYLTRAPNLEQEIVAS